VHRRKLFHRGDHLEPEIIGDQILEDPRVRMIEIFKEPDYPLFLLSRSHHLVSALCYGLHAVKVPMRTGQNDALSAAAQSRRATVRLKTANGASGRLNLKKRNGPLSEPVGPLALARSAQGSV
jgi:hypothetical protein